MALNTFTIFTPNGERQWQADDSDHAIEQHLDMFPKDSDPNEKIELIVWYETSADGRTVQCFDDGSCAWCLGKDFKHADTCEVR